ncbi:MAG: hypothetical protein Q4P36_01755 [Bowdeniella nasicola]|nr:hypothetical protein [Bowdeniella nasicola]
MNTPALGPRRDPHPIPPTERARLRDAAREETADTGVETDREAAASSAETGHEAAAPSADELAAAGDVEVAHRAAPRYGRFMAAGLLAGALVAFIIAIVTRGWSALSTSDTFWLLTISLGFIGLALGAALALYLDRRSLRALARQLPDAGER